MPVNDVDGYAYPSPNPSLVDWMSYLLSTEDTETPVEPRTKEDVLPVNNLEFFDDVFRTIGGHGSTGEQHLALQHMTRKFLSDRKNNNIDFLRGYYDIGHNGIAATPEGRYYFTYMIGGARFVKLGAAVNRIEKALDMQRFNIVVVRGALRIKPKSRISQGIEQGYISALTIMGAGKDRRVSAQLLTLVIDAARAMSDDYRKLVRERFKGSVAVPTTPGKPVRSGTGDLDTYLSNRRRDVKEQDVTTVFTIPEHGVLSSLNWGIEVELAGARGVERAPGWDSRYDGSLESPYGGGDEPEEPDYVSAPDEPDEPCLEDYILDADKGATEGERDEYDAAMTDYLSDMEQYRDDYEDWERYESDMETWREDYYEWEHGEDGEGSREFVSPILHSYHSKGLESILSQVDHSSQNDSAGIHVHVDASGLTVKQLGSLVYGYTMLENILESSYKRNTRTYCKGLSAAGLRKTGASARRMARDRGTSKNLHNVHSEDRYLSLNLEALNAHGTVEFRAMGPRYEYETLIRWAQICREFVNVAMAGATPRDWNRVKNASDLVALFVRMGKETADNQLSPILQEDIDAIFQKNDDFRYNGDRAELVEIGGEI
jgi:hypothetical protein